MDHIDVKVLLKTTLANKASDIHVEPEHDEVRIRFRVDGVLVQIINIDRETYSSIITRVKLLSGMKINIHTSAQDWRFSVRIDEREIEFRVSILPGGYGESIVMRLLDPKSINIGLQLLGIRPQLLDIIKSEINRLLGTNKSLIC